MKKTLIAIGINADPWGSCAPLSVGYDYLWLAAA